MHMNESSPKLSIFVTKTEITNLAGASVVRNTNTTRFLSTLKLVNKNSLSNTFSPSSIIGKIVGIQCANIRLF